MERIFRLEFNEQQQVFHKDDYTHEQNTYGWFTIFEFCTNLEFVIYKSYVNRIKKDKLTKNYLLQCAVEVKSFMINLLEYNISISQNKTPTDGK